MNFIQLKKDIFTAFDQYKSRSMPFSNEVKKRRSAENRVNFFMFIFFLYFPLFIIIPAGFFVPHVDDERAKKAFVVGGVI